MREDSRYYNGKDYDLHWHDGGTCHGSPTLQACIKEAIKNGWAGKVLRKDDVYRDGSKVSCFSLIASDFDHWKKYGTFVAVVELTSRLLEEDTAMDKFKPTADTAKGKTSPALVPLDKPHSDEVGRMIYLEDGYYANGIFLRYKLYEEDGRGHVRYTRYIQLHVPYAADEKATWWEERGSLMRDL